MTYSGHQIFKTLIRCDFSPQATTGQRYVYSGSCDGCVYIYDMITGNLHKRLKLSSNLIREASWNPYVPMIVAASWDAKASSAVYTHAKPKNGLLFTADL
jgi:WD repeat-containing protein 23